MDKNTYIERLKFGMQKAMKEAIEYHHISIRNPKMSRKRFKKLMMYHRVPRDVAEEFCNAIGQGKEGSYFNFYIWLTSRGYVDMSNFFLDDCIKIGGGA